MYAEIVTEILGVAVVEADWMVGAGIDDEFVIEVGAETGLGLGVEVEVGLGVDIEDETAGVGDEPKELHNC